MNDVVEKMQELELRRRRSMDGKVLGYEVIDARSGEIKGRFERYSRHKKDGHNKHAMFAIGGVPWFDNQLGIVSLWLELINSGKLG